MPQAHADPDELEQFSHQLQGYISELEVMTASLQQRFQGLSATWHDQEQQRFEAEFEQLTQTMRRFAVAVEPLVPHLQTKAAHLRDYLG
jgi:WXG100 family type VII secretion target